MQEIKVFCWFLLYKLFDANNAILNKNFITLYSQKRYKGGIEGEYSTGGCEGDCEQMQIQFLMTGCEMARILMLKMKELEKS